MPDLKAECMIIRSSTRSWKHMCEDAAAFATRVGKDRLINISVSAAGDNLGAEGTIFVWYWDDGTLDVKKD
jgi:hypothetical protein